MEHFIDKKRSTRNCIWVENFPTIANVTKDRSESHCRSRTVLLHLTSLPRDSHVTSGSSLAGMRHSMYTPATAGESLVRETALLLWPISCSLTTSAHSAQQSSSSSEQSKQSKQVIWFEDSKFRKVCYEVKTSLLRTHHKPPRLKSPGL